MSENCRQCNGCALRPGTLANLEPENRIRGVFAVLGGVPFHCHEKLGWTHGVAGYPEGTTALKNAIVDLLSAPKLVHDSPWASDCLSDATPQGFPLEMFDPARQVIGKYPVCAGWKAAVADLARQAWYKNPAYRPIATRALGIIDELDQDGNNASRLAEIQSLVDWFIEQLNERGIDAAPLFEPVLETEGATV